MNFKYKHKPRITKFYNMKTRLVYNGKTTSLCRACPTSKSIKKQSYSFYPNYLLINGMIHNKFSRPVNLGKTIKRDDSFDGNVDIVNEVLPQYEKAVGIVYSCVEEEDVLSNWSYSTFSVLKVGNVLLGASCLHLLNTYKDLTKIKFFVSFSETANEIGYDIPKSKITSDFLEVSIYPNYMEVRDKVIKNLQNSEFSFSESDLFHDILYDLHGYRTLDILLFQLPDELVKERELSKEFIVMADFTSYDWCIEQEGFCYFIGYHSPSTLTDSEYKLTIPDSNTLTDSTQLIYPNIKTVTFGKIQKLWAISNIITNTFPLCSGSLLLDPNNRAIAMLGLSLEDDQTQTTLSNDNACLPFNDITECSEKIKDGSYNSNLGLHLHHPLLKDIYKILNITN